MFYVILFILAILGLPAGINTWLWAADDDYRICKAYKHATWAFGHCWSAEQRKILRKRIAAVILVLPAFYLLIRIGLFIICG